MSSVQEKLLLINDFTQTIAQSEEIPEEEIPELACTSEELSEETEKVRRICTLLFAALCEPNLSSPCKQKIRALVEKMCLMAKADPTVNTICQLFFTASLASKKIATFSPLFTAAAMPTLQKACNFENFRPESLRLGTNVSRTSLMLRNTFFHDPEVPLSLFHLSFDALVDYLSYFLETSNFKRTAECLDLLYENKWSEAFTHFLTTTSQRTAIDMNLLYLLGDTLTPFSKNMVKIIAYKETEEPPRKRQKTEEPSHSCFMHKVFLEPVPFFKTQFNAHWAATQEGAAYQTLEVGVEDPSLLLEILKHLTSYRSSIHISWPPASDEPVTKFAQYVATCEFLVEQSLPQLYWKAFTAQYSQKKFTDTKTLNSYTTRADVAKETHSSFFLAKHFSFLIEGIANNTSMALKFLTKTYQNPTKDSLSQLLAHIDSERTLVAPHLEVSFSSLKHIGKSDQKANQEALLRICSAIISLGSPLCGDWWQSFVQDFSRDEISCQTADSVICSLFERKTTASYILGLTLLKNIGSIRYKEAFELNQKLLTSDVIASLNSEIKKKNGSALVADLLSEMLLNVAAFGYTQLFDEENQQAYLRSFAYHAGRATPLACLDQLEKNRDSYSLIVSSFMHKNDQIRGGYLQRCLPQAQALLESKRAPLVEELIVLKILKKAKKLSSETAIPSQITVLHPFRSCTFEAQFFSDLYGNGQGRLTTLFTPIPLPYDLLRTLVAALDSTNPPPARNLDLKKVWINRTFDLFKNFQNRPMFKTGDFFALLSAIVQAPPHAKEVPEVRRLVFWLAESSPILFHLQQESKYLGSILNILLSPQIIDTLSAQEHPVFIKLFRFVYTTVKSIGESKHAEGLEKYRQQLIEKLTVLSESAAKQELLAFLKS